MAETATSESEVYAFPFLSFSVPPQVIQCFLVLSLRSSLVPLDNPHSSVALYTFCSASCLGVLSVPLSLSPYLFGCKYGEVEFFFPVFAFIVSYHLIICVLKYFEIYSCKWHTYKKNITRVHTHTPAIKPPPLVRNSNLLNQHPALVQMLV